MEDERRRQLHSLWKKAIDRWEKHPGTKFYNDIRFYDTTYYVLDKNYIELISTLKKYEADYTLIAQDNERQFHASMREVLRLLHNYLASVQSFIDHTRVFVNESCPVLNTEKDKRLEELTSNGCARFTKEFRNFVQHKRLPSPSTSLHVERKDLEKEEFEEEIKILLHKKELLEWDGWSSKSRKYIEIMEDEIKLRDVFEPYKALNELFYIWVRSRALEIRRHDLEEMYKVHAEIGRIEEMIDGLRTVKTPVS